MTIAVKTYKRYIQGDETLKINPIYNARKVINMFYDKLTGRGSINTTRYI